MKARAEDDAKQKPSAESRRPREIGRATDGQRGTNGISLRNVPIFYQNTARGVVLLLAVAPDQLSRERTGA